MNIIEVENLEFEYSSLMFEDADDAMQQMLNKIRNQKEYYVLECEERGQVFIVCEVENSIYFLSVFDEAWVVRSHMVCFEQEDNIKRNQIVSFILALMIFAGMCLVPVTANATETYDFASFSEADSE